MMAQRIGVRELVEFECKSGDLDASQSSTNTALEGARIHRMLQKQAGPNYEKEVTLKAAVTLAGEDYTIDGRADGVDKDDASGLTIVDEIKTSALDFAELSDDALGRYWAQAAVYGHFLCTDRQLDRIILQLTYYQTTTKQITRQQWPLPAADLAEYYQALLHDYAGWVIFRHQLKQERDASLTPLTFPFGDFRPQQREFAAAVYKTIHTQQRLFVQAPTGTGKTMATLFPAVKAMPAEGLNRLFYLTAKEATRQSAEDGCRLLIDQGAQLRCITLTAKDKISFCPPEKRTPDLCPYYRGYYDRNKAAVKDIISHERLLDRATIERYAKKHTVDPFELSLDAARFADVVICDYNYLFDPLVFLQRFFAQPDSSQFFLIDEAHNLIHRARDMYSATLTSAGLSPLAATLRQHHQREASNALRQLRTAFTAVGKALTAKEQNEWVSVEALTEFNQKVARFVERIHEWLPGQPADEDIQAVLPVYFDCISYSRIAELYGEQYRTVVEREHQQVRITQLCLDPEPFVDACLHKGRGAVLFSATLSPLTYYQELLADPADSLVYQLPSPFPAGHQLVVIRDDVATTYQRRAANEARIVAALAAFAQTRTGNYLVFLPSYHYLEQVYMAFSAAYPEITVFSQTGGMAATDRAAFLAHFQPHPTATSVGFAVLGGSFGEGIDLPADRLIGVAVVGVGLPGLSLRNNLLKAYFNARNGQGFTYAYQLPGLNNVLQAGGRLIRGMHDRGVILLLDERFAQPRYQHYLPLSWTRNLRLAHTDDQLTTLLTDFWKEDHDDENRPHPGS